MPEVADIFRRYGQEYLDAFGPRMLPSHHRAFRDILECRTPALGGHVYRCDACGREQFVYHSCRNRSCPKCHGRDTRAWLADRKSELLPVPYFHVVFTVPSPLRRIIRRRQKDLLPLLMKAAAKALIKLAADPHYVGGLIGVLAVLHTWTRTLEYHPHVHCLVPGGGLTDDGQWRPARSNYLVPVKALSRIFRGIFLDAAAKQLPSDLSSSLRRQPWVVYAKPTCPGPDRVLAYLGRYVHRIAITNSRILAVDDGKVTFRYRPSDDSQWRTMTLAASEFIRRFLQHVLPKGVHKVRYYGLWAPSNRPRLRQIQITLAADAPAKPSQERQPTADSFTLSPPSPPAARGAVPCPHCHRGTLVPVRRIPPQRRAPP
jgi:hypothetical protein